MKTINNIGIIGAGTMGSALAQKFAQQGFNVVLIDLNQSALDAAIKLISKTLNQAVEIKLFSKENVAQILGRISTSTDSSDLAKSDLVIEAIIENLEAKTALFEKLSSILSEDAILATNTSSFSVSSLAKYYSRPENFIGLHYFFHAAKNRLVEIIPAEKTSTDTVKAIELFCFLSGKDPIECKDSNGFVVNRFFVPWLNESAKLLEEGVASIPVIDRICRETFKIAMGPFVLMNATGVPVAFHSQKTLEIFGPAYLASERLGKQTELNIPWEFDPENEGSCDAETEKIIKDRMLGIVFFVCSQLLAEGICSPADINRGARIGLRWKKGPIDLMKIAGEEEVQRLVKLIATLNGDEIPLGVEQANWEIEYLNYTVNNSVATLQFCRPEDLNALNKIVMKELSEKFDLAINDPQVQTIILTGSGKAFVAGADIGFFVKNIRSKNIPDIIAFTEFGQNVFDEIDQSPKRVVAILNGLTLGGGLELALCADTILALPQATLAFPETGIGIFPGLGGTQRTPKRTGKGLAKYLVLSGQMLRATDALQIGLVDSVITPAQMFSIISGNEIIPENSKSKTIKGTKWEKLSRIFEQQSLDEILMQNNNLDLPDPEKLIKKLRYKAPIPMHISERLINEEKGTESELAEIANVFGTEDALIGLSGIGKRVEFSGK